MTIRNHLGFPRIGLDRELKKAKKIIGRQDFEEELVAVGKSTSRSPLAQQADAGVELLPVGDFAWYDQVLSTSLLLGNVPPRHHNEDGSLDLDTLFRVARGRAPTGKPAAASEMTKWFNTNYHYIVPEFQQGQSFTFAWKSC